MKLSSLFYRLHLQLKKLGKKGTAPAPYKLCYCASGGAVPIVHVNGNFIVGGSSQLIVDIIERTSGVYNHSIVVPEHPEPPPYRPVSIHAFPIARMRSLFEYLKTERPALVHIHYWVREEYRYSKLGLWYAAVFRICEELKLAVVQNVNVPTPPYKSSAVAHNVYVSSYVQEHFGSGNSVPASVIYPGSDFKHFQTPMPQGTRAAAAIGMVYRLDPDKLNAEAIDVFISVAKKRKDVTCYIVGGGAFYKHYRKRVREEGLERNFVFTGFVSYGALPAYYSRMDVFVAPVHNESFGQVTPFAMSMGLPVAGYDIGALAEILGRRSTLVEYGKREALAALIVDLLNDADGRAQLALQNQKRAHALFSVETMIERYRELYATYTARPSAAVAEA